MPCEDITEVLRLTIDDRDRLVGYTLTKLTCGGKVSGRSLIRDFVKRKTLSDIMSLTSSQVISSSGVADEFEEFLYVKHLFSIQSAISAITGESTGRPDDFCVINTISHGDKGIELLAEIKIDLLTDQIKACNRVV